MYCEWCGQDVAHHDLRCPKNPFHPDRGRGEFVFANPSDRKYCRRCGRILADCACAGGPGGAGES
ncbi:MAG: hypothetical protein HY720_12035 [Planctomycetes bacterium]|nr:hypothetical protein [Planctomycetota bacterium]